MILNRRNVSPITFIILVINSMKTALECNEHFMSRSFIMKNIFIIIIFWITFIRTWRAYTIICRRDRWSSGNRRLIVDFLKKNSLELFFLKKPFLATRRSIYDRRNSGFYARNLESRKRILVKRSITAYANKLATHIYWISK